MMNLIRRAILTFALIAGITPAFAQVPPPVPALPDTERRTSYSISASNCACAVGFQLYGDSTDVANWLEIFVNGVMVPQSGGWTISSPTGPIATIPRPITDAVLTFTTAQTGTVQIVGARRPRRTSQFQESQPVPTRNFNQTFSDIIATQRELWDKTNDFTGRGVFAPPGETLKLLPALANRLNQGACFDNGGNLTTCVGVPSSAFVAGSGITFTGVGPTTVSCTIFSSSLPGCAPASGGGITSFARADSTFAVPPTFSSGAPGYVPASGGGISNYLRANATFGSPLNAVSITEGGTPAACDYRVVSDAAMASGSTTLTSTTGLFTANDGTNHSYIAVAGAGAAGVTLFTTIQTFVSATQVTLASANASGGAISAKIAEFGTDDTTAINATIVSASAALQDAYVPAGKSCLASRINLANRFNFRFFGQGYHLSKIFPKQDASYNTTAGHLFDMTGSANVIIDNLQIGAFYELAVPQTAIFMAQVASGAANRNGLTNLYVSGQFTIATFYDYGVPSLYTIQDNDFYNYRVGAGAAGVMTLTANNINSFTSSFATVTSGFQSTSDITFMQDEFHKFAGAGADSWVVRLEATTNISFYGGVISGGASAYAFYDGANLHISYFNMTFETESQPVTPTNGHFKSTGTVTDLNDVGSSYIISGAKFNPAATPTNLVTNAQ